MRFTWSMLVICIACGSKSGGNGGTTADAAASIDAPANVPATITISGTVVEKSTSGSTPISDATIVAKKASDDSMVATAMTNGSGAYTLTVTTNGEALDGYLDVTDGGSDVETFVYPPAPIGTNYSAPAVQMVTQATINELPILTSVTQNAADALLGLEVVDTSGTPVAGATVSTTPAGSAIYDSSSGLPTKTQKATNTDGVAFVFNVPPGAVTVMATGSGDTFKSHSINGRAGVVTETLVTE